MEKITEYRKPRILFTTPVLQHPPVGGPYLRIENSIMALSQISELIVYSQILLTDKTGLNYYPNICTRFFNLGSLTPWGEKLFQIDRISNYLARKLFHRDYHIPFIKSRKWKELLQIIEDTQPDIIWLGYGNISYPLLRFLKEKTTIPIVCDTDSVWSRFILRGLPYAHNESDREKIRVNGKRKEEEEQWGTNIADITTAVSEVDAKYYRELAISHNQIQIFSNVINLTDYTQIPNRPADLINPCIFLAGSFGPKSPMEEAARWTIEKVLPLIKDQFPEIHLYIIGSGSKETLHDINDPSITITGRVDSVLPYLCHSDVALVPLKFESGTRFKILEAGACKKPVVSTTLGAEGIPITHGENILIADEHKDFAKAIITLLSDPSYANNIGMSLFSLIRENYDLPTLVQEGEGIINLLLNLEQRES